MVSRSNIVVAYGRVVLVSIVITPLFLPDGKLALAHVLQSEFFTSPSNYRRV
jgi:hypothetical protein